MGCNFLFFMYNNNYRCISQNANFRYIYFRLGVLKNMNACVCRESVLNYMNEKG